MYLLLLLNISLVYITNLKTNYIFIDYDTEENIQYPNNYDSTVITGLKHIKCAYERNHNFNVLFV